MIKVPLIFSLDNHINNPPSIEDFDSCAVPIWAPSIIIKTASFAILLLLLLLLLFIAPHKEKETQLEKLQSLESQPISLPPPHKEKKAQLVKLQSFRGKAMKVHPLPNKRNSVTIQYNPNPRGGPPLGGTHKKLRRLPHIFNRVLELPFRSDADVSVEEGPDFFRFVAETEAVAGGVRAHMVEIHPGVTKIVVRPNGYLGFASLDELELDMWRFRLPESTRPELASAVFEGGELVVTVPKGEEGVEEEDDDDGGEFMGGMGNNSNSPSSRLVFVQ